MEEGTRAYKLRTLLINKDVIASICAYTTGTYVYCIEKATRMHMHWYIELEKGEEGLRKILRNAGLKGNSGYSLKQLEPDPENPECPFIGYLAYIVKENKEHVDELIHSVNMHEMLLQAKNYDLQVKENIGAKKEKKVWKVIANAIRDELVKKNLSPSDMDLTHKEIAHYVVKYHVDNQLLIRGHMLTSYVDTIWLYLQEERRDLMVYNTAHINSYAEAVASNSVLIKYNDLKNRK